MVYWSRGKAKRGSASEAAPSGSALPKAGHSLILGNRISPVTILIGVGMLVHPDAGSNLAERLRDISPEVLWDGNRTAVPGGRGSVRRMELEGKEYLLKRERRGGLLGNLLPDGFFRRAPFLEEWELSLILSREALTPPILARWFIRRGPLFRVYSLVEPLPRAASLVSLWRAGGLTPEILKGAGACVGSLHRRGVRHGDLNAGNLLELPGRGVVAIDWRRSRIEDPLSPGTRKDNLLRLARSLHKVAYAHSLPWPERSWESLAQGYAEGYGSEEPWLREFCSAAERGFTWRRILWPLTRK
jgi:3-deoxy-D-manno-octulosonic acid kinase